PSAARSPRSCAASSSCRSRTGRAGRRSSPARSPGKGRRRRRRRRNASSRGRGGRPASSPAWPDAPTASPARGPRSRRDSLPRLLEDVAENAGDLVELVLVGHERRRDLDDRVAAIVGPADEAALEHPRREEAAQERLALLVGECLARLLVLDELDCVEETGSAQVADDRQL